MALASVFCAAHWPTKHKQGRGEGPSIIDLYHFCDAFASDFGDTRIVLVICLMKDHVAKFPFVHKLAACGNGRSGSVGSVV
jgi:hypothetical protein